MSGRTNIRSDKRRVGQTSGRTNDAFCIGRTNDAFCVQVGQMAGQTNVAVGKMSSWTNVGRTNVGRTNVGRKKVASSLNVAIMEMVLKSK
jgi:hypothetical protein